MVHQRPLEQCGIAEYLPRCFRTVGHTADGYTHLQVRRIQAHAVEQVGGIQHARHQAPESLVITADKHRDTRDETGSTLHQGHRAVDQCLACIAGARHINVLRGYLAVIKPERRLITRDWVDVTNDQVRGRRDVSHFRVLGEQARGDAVERRLVQIRVGNDRCGHTAGQLQEITHDTFGCRRQAFDLTPDLIHALALFVAAVTPVHRYRQYGQSNPQQHEQRYVQPEWAPAVHWSKTSTTDAMTRIIATLLLVLAALPAAAAPVVPAEILARYPHDTDAFTQGLVWHDGRLFESTGLYGRSSLREVDLATGRRVRESALGENEFGEGLTVVDGRLVQLTWRNGRAHVYDAATLERVSSWRFRGEGWGLTYDGTHLVMSDGSDELQFRDPQDFSVVRRLPVTLQGQRLPLLNALQYIDGRIYANVWTTTMIAIIDPVTGITERVIDLTPLIEQLGFTPRMDYQSPNGIAYDATGNRLFVTGKLWPWVFEIRRPQ